MICIHGAGGFPLVKHCLPEQDIQLDDTWPGDCVEVVLTWLIPFASAPRGGAMLRQAIIVVPLGLVLAGCMDATVLAYDSLTRELDGRSELHVSTYPAGFPRETASIPFLYKALRTPESVYFQVFVRDAEQRAGPNPHIQSARIHAFSYAFPGQDPVVLVEDFDGYFWMQDNPEQSSARDKPVPYDEHSYLQLRVELTVNGVDYLVEEQVRATQRRNITPLLLYALH